MENYSKASNFIKRQFKSFVYLSIIDKKLLPFLNYRTKKRKEFVFVLFAFAKD
jgi:hypothetical protein